MRKIFIAVMAFAAVAFAGCSKEAVNDIRNDLRIKFTVANKPSLSSDTRALKSGWESGDQILLVFQGASGPLDYNNGSNTITLTYNGISWSADKSKINTSLLSSDEKSYKAIYHPGNVTFGSYDSHFGGYPLTGYKGGEQLEYSGLYSYENDIIDLDIISLTRDSRDFQISVKDLTGNNWTLSIMNGSLGNSGVNIIHAMTNKLYLNPNSFLLEPKFANYTDVTRDATGVEYGGDVSFFFKKINTTIATTLTFVLTNGTDTYHYTKTSVTDSTLEGGKAYYLPAITEAGWEQQ